MVGGRKVVGLDWVELDEGLMAWWRVLQMIDEDSYLGDNILERREVRIRYSSLIRDSSDWLSCFSDHLKH